MASSSAVQVDCQLEIAKTESMAKVRQAEDSWGVHNFASNGPENLIRCLLEGKETGWDAG